MSTQQQLDAINDAIGRGRKKVRFPDGSEVEYHSLSEMMELREQLMAEIAAKDNASGLPTFEFGLDRGLGGGI